MRSDEFLEHQAWASIAEAREKIVALGDGTVSEEIQPVSDILQGLDLAETVKSASALLIDSEQMDRLQEIAAAAASSAVEGIEKRVDVSEELSAHRDELINVLGELPVNIADSATLDSYQRAIGGLRIPSLKHNRAPQQRGGRSPRRTRCL